MNTSCLYLQKVFERSVLRKVSLNYHTALLPTIVNEGPKSVVDVMLEVLLFWRGAVILERHYVSIVLNRSTDLIP